MNIALSSFLPRPKTARNPARLSADQADALLAINADLPAPAPEWVEFVGETVSHWLVEDMAPTGEVDEAKARWLLARVGRAGSLNAAALVLVQRCCIKAQRVSGELTRFLVAEEARLRA